MFSPERWLIWSALAAETVLATLLLQHRMRLWAASLCGPLIAAASFALLNRIRMGHLDPFWLVGAVVTFVANLPIAVIAALCASKLQHNSSR
jgi:hypothetical protein